MRVSAMNFEGRQQLITESPTLPDHIATKQYVDESVPALVSAAIANRDKGAMVLPVGQAADLEVSHYFVVNASGNRTISLTNTSAINGKPTVLVFEIHSTGTVNLIWDIPNLTFSRGMPIALTPNGKDLLAIVTKDGNVWDMVSVSPAAAALA